MESCWAEQFSHLLLILFLTLSFWIKRQIKRHTARQNTTQRVNNRLTRRALRAIVRGVPVVGNEVGGAAEFIKESLILDSSSENYGTSCLLCSTTVQQRLFCRAPIPGLPRQTILSGCITQ